MLELPLNFNGLDEIHIENSHVVSGSGFPVCKPIYTLAIRVDQDTYETELKLLYRTQLPDALIDDPNVRPGGRELRSKEIAMSALGPNVDFHFSSIEDLDKFFDVIKHEARLIGVPPKTCSEEG